MLVAGRYRCAYMYLCQRLRSLCLTLRNVLCSVGVYMHCALTSTWRTQTTGKHTLSFRLAKVLNHEGKSIDCSRKSWANLMVNCGMNCFELISCCRYKCELRVAAVGFFKIYVIVINVKSSIPKHGY